MSSSVGEEYTGLPQLPSQGARVRFRLRSVRIITWPVSLEQKATMVGGAPDNLPDGLQKQGARLCNSGVC